jgi:ribulose-phosphate 3-epimerase
MIVQPERYLEEFRKAGADIISVHYEASTHLHRTISEIKRLGAKAGVVLNPATSVSQLEDIINDVDMVLIMSVNPGFGGQKFIENTYKKLIQLKDLIFEKGSSSLVEVDGGVDLENSFQIIKSGGDILVAGNTVFSSQNPSQTISELKHISR